MKAEVLLTILLAAPAGAARADGEIESGPGLSLTGTLRAAEVVRRPADRVRLAFEPSNVPVIVRAAVTQGPQSVSVRVEPELRLP